MYKIRVVLIDELSKEYFIPGELVKVVTVNRITYTGRLVQLFQNNLKVDVSENYNSRIIDISLTEIDIIEKI